MAESLSLGVLRERFGVGKRREGALREEIGRAASSSPRFHEAFGPLAEAVGTVIPFDRMSIRFVDLDDGTFTEAYFAGIEIPGHEAGADVPLEGTVTEAAVRGQTPIRIGDELPEVLAARYPGAGAAFASGIRSVLVVPMAPPGRIVPTLMLASTRPKAYTDRHLDMAKRAAAGIAVPLANAIANAGIQLSLQDEVAERERQVSELEEAAAARRTELGELHEQLAAGLADSRKAKALADVGLAAGASIHLDDAYEDIAQKLEALLSFDRLEAASIDSRSGTVTMSFVRDMGGAAPPPTGALPHCRHSLREACATARRTDRRTRAVGGPGSGRGERIRL